MKQIVIFLSFFLSFWATAQQATFDNLRARSILRPPAYSSLNNATAAGSQQGNLVYIHTGADTGVYVRSWDNSRWIKVSGFEGSGSTSHTHVSSDVLNFNAAVRATTLTGFNPSTANSPIVAADTIIRAFSKAQAQLNDRWTLSGNANASTSRIGSTNNTPVRFIQNNENRMEFSTAGRIFFGNNSTIEPISFLQRIESTSISSSGNNLGGFDIRGGVINPEPSSPAIYLGQNSLSTRNRTQVRIGGQVNVLDTSTAPARILHLDAEFNNLSNTPNIGIDYNPPTVSGSGSHIAAFFRSGNVAIGSTAPNSAASLHLSGTNRGFLPNVVTTSQRNGIVTPPKGLIVFDETVNKLSVYDGSNWRYFQYE